MSQNSITLTQDTVIKMTIKQGVEDDRNSSTYGKFDTGELAFTRDTKRIFVGDCNMNDDTNIETIGGSISGNKYLGMVDSKRKLSGQNNGLPIGFETNVVYENGEEYEKSLLLNDSNYRNNNKRWTTKATYNESLDAYDGDYIYDVYTNSIIFFDHRITTDKSKQPVVSNDDETPNVEIPIDDTIDGKRKTIIKNYDLRTSDTEDSGKETQPTLTYGEGYVIFRNIIPDNKTIRFVKREFDKNTGEPSDSEKGTYSHNILEIFNVPANTMYESFDENIFTRENPISLKKVLPVDELVSRTAGNILTLPNTISFKNDSDDTATYSFSTSDKKNTSSPYELQVIKNGESDYSISVVPSIIDDSEPVIRLGDGLEAIYSANERSSILRIDDESVILALKYSSNDFDKGYYKDPFYTESSDTTIYVKNLGYDGGMLSIIDDYSIQYKNKEDENNKTVSSYIDNFQNKNSSLNLFKKPFFLGWTGVSNSYNEAFSANLQGTIYKFPHISKKEMFTGISTSTFSEEETIKTLTVVGNNTSSPTLLQKLAINNYPNQGDVWNPDSSLNNIQLYSYPISVSRSNTSLENIFDSPQIFSSFMEMLELENGIPKISSPIFGIVKNKINNEDVYSFVSELPQISTNENDEELLEDEYTGEAPEEEYTEESLLESFNYSAVITNIEKIYIDSELIFDASTKTLIDDGGFFHKVIKDDEIMGFVATEKSNLFNASNITSNPDTPVKRSIIIYYKTEDGTETHNIDINPQEYWDYCSFYENVVDGVSTFYIDIPETNSNYEIVINEETELNIIQKVSDKVALYKYNSSGILFNEAIELTPLIDYTREEIATNWYECKINKSVYQSSNCSALAFNVTNRTYYMNEEENYSHDDNPIRIIYQTPLVRFANIAAQPDLTSPLNNVAKNYKIPHTATSILIEMTNDTNEIIYVVTSNSFNNLKKFEDDLTANRCDFWKLNDDDSLPVLNVNEESWNTLYPNEKALKNLLPNSREIVEVPLIDTLSGTKDFFLRISNITNAQAPKFVMRVVGYRS